MADLTPEQAIEKLRTLPEDKQRAVLGRLSPEQRKGILGKLTASTKTPGQLKASVAPDRFTQDRDITEKWAEGHPILGPVARFAVTAGQNAASAITEAPSGAYHAFADPATPEETKRYGADQVTGAKRVGLGIGRLLGREQAENAIEDYSAGKVTPKAALSVLPEALGTGVGQVTGGAVYGKGTEIVGEGLSTVGKLRAKAGNSFARKITGVEPALKEATTKAADSHANTLSEHAETAANVAKRGDLAKTIDTQSQELHGHLSKVEQSVAKEANRKFDAVRAKVGNPEAPADELVGTVKGVEQNVLQGIPENIKEFRAILKMEPLPDNIRGAAEAHGFDLEGTEPLTWEKLQSLKSRLDARLRNSRNMNGDLKRAVYQTRDAVVGEMGKMAEANGAGEEWGQARDFWRQYKEDFHESSGPSGSGSPVAQALAAEDPKNIRQPFLRTQSAIGNRGVETLRKYPEHGGTEAAEHVTKIISGQQELTDLPNKPKGFSPEPPAGPTVDAAKVARDAIAQRAKNWGSFNARDIGILASSVLAEPIMKVLGGNLGQGATSLLPVAAISYEGGKYAAARALNNPAVIEWLSKTPPEEAAALSKIPGADKVKITNLLTDTAVKAARGGQSTLIPGGTYDSSFTKSSNPETNPSRFNSKTSDYDAHLLTLKDGQGKRVGSVSWHPAPGESGVAEIHHSDLDASLRGKGVGKEMYRQVIEDARRKGFRSIRADDEISPDAVRVWNSLGAQTVTDSLGRQRLQLDISRVPATGGVPLSPAAKNLLGPANVAKILAVGSAGVVKNRRDALERLRFANQ